LVLPSLRLLAKSLLEMSLARLQKSLLAFPEYDGAVVLALLPPDVVVAPPLAEVVALPAPEVVALPPDAVVAATDGELSPPQPARRRATRAAPATRPEAFMTVSSQIRGFDHRIDSRGEPL